jgi:hypothetical protein
MNKRYAIVRVDKLKFCPSDIEGINDKLVCSKTKDGESKVCICRYGDTKEQMMKKIAQVLIRRKHKLYRKIWGGDWCDREREDSYKQCLEAAKEIVEFLGVE